MKKCNNKATSRRRVVMTASAFSGPTTTLWRRHSFTDRPTDPVPPSPTAFFFCTIRATFEWCASPARRAPLSMRWLALL
eukprot:4808274-Prymnesium_polylepis.2